MTTANHRRLQQMSVPCPTCGAASGLGCRRKNGLPRTSIHIERSRAAFPPDPVVTIKKKIHRYGAFLKLHSRKGVQHAVLHLQREPQPNTPEAFFEELAEEDKIKKIAKMNRFDCEWRLHLATRR